MKNMINQKLSVVDKEVKLAIDKELRRQQNTLELIAPENIVSKAVLEAQGSILTNKSAEGFVNKRYFGGCEHVDFIEQLAIERACQLFGAKYANVQLNSGSQANQAVFYALLQPNDTILGMSLNMGGHLSHGSKVNISGQLYNSVSYGLSKSTETIDYDEVLKLAKKHKPKLIIAGASSYSRNIDYAKFREIADEVDAILMADIAHIAGFIVADLHQNPMQFADVVTSTTHKTLRGPRGGMVLTNNPEIAKKVDTSVSPGMQGGPLMHIIAAKAVAFKEALEPDFKEYMMQVKLNAQAMADCLVEHGVRVISGGTDNHLFLIDTMHSFNLTGQMAEEVLEKVGVVCNKNGIPNDTLSPHVTSGLRFGTSVITSRGILADDAHKIAELVYVILSNTKENGDISEELVNKIKKAIHIICKKNPLY